MIQFVTQTLHKDIFIVGYKQSMSNAILDSVPASNLLFLDSLWPNISADKMSRSVNPSDEIFSLLIQLGFSEQLSLASLARYPGDKQKAIAYAATEKKQMTKSMMCPGSGSMVSNPEEK